MPGLFQVDTDSLQKDPNLKFDPQNASGHLGDSHPTFQQLKEGLTPEQVEILETVSQVDNFDIDEVPEDDVEFIDPETGEIEKSTADELGLDDLGFLDPSNMRTITLEAFNSFKLEHVNELIRERYEEITAKRNHLLRTGYVSRIEANNINDMLGGTLSDNVIMESFTTTPTKVNFNLVMEEMTNGQKALAAGGAVVGVTLLYKLIKWCLNAWNKNGVANGSISENIRVIQERRARLNNSEEVIRNVQESFQKAQAKFKDATSDNMKDKEFSKIINKYGDAKNINDVSKAQAVAKELYLANLSKNMETSLSNLWLTMFNKSSVSFNAGSFTFNKDFITKMQAAAQACIEITNTSKAKIEDIQTTSINSTVNTSGDDAYNKSVTIIKQFATACGFNLDTTNINSSGTELSNHIIQHITGNVKVEIPDGAYSVDLSFIDSTTFAIISDEFLNDIREFGESLNKAGGGNESKLQRVLGNENKGSVNVGDNVQRDTRLKEYDKAAKHFRVAMNVLRGIHAIRNNVGKGLKAISNSLE